MNSEELKEGENRVTQHIKSGNEIGNEGARMISDSLKINSTLTSIDLSGDSLFNSALWKKKVERVFKDEDNKTTSMYRQ